MRIDLPWSKPPLSMNDRDHWRVKANKVARARMDTRIAVTLACLKAGSEHLLDGAVLTLHYQPRDNRRRDTDNLFATVKACADGIRDAGIIPDDDTRYLSHREPVIHAPVKGEPGRLWLVLEPREEGYRCTSCNSLTPVLVADAEVCVRCDGRAGA